MLERPLLAFAALFLLSATARAADWPVEKAGEKTCVATGPETKDANLSVVTFGPQLMLLIGSDDFPQAKDSYKIGLSFDGNPVVTVEAEGIKGQYGIPVTPQLADALRRATRLDAVYAGKTYSFALDGAGAAIEAVLHCAGQPSYDQLTVHHITPVSGAGRWLIEDMLPTSDTCTARANGAEVDTVLMLNQSGKVIVVAAHPDWARPLTKFEAALRIDQDPPLKKQASAFTNLVLVPVTDDETTRLRGAHTLAWHFPWGDYHAEVDGLGLALDALVSCQAKKHPAP